MLVLINDNLSAAIGDISGFANKVETFKALQKAKYC